MIKCTGSLILPRLKTKPWQISSRGLARIRREAPKKPSAEVLEALSTPISSAHSGYVAQADKIMGAMRAKVNASSTATQIKEGEVEENNSWNWIPPRDNDDEEEQLIPVIRGVLLTTAEITDALKAQGGIDVMVIEMREPLDTITHMVLVTGRSLKHLRKMSDSIVSALKVRRLKKCIGIKGAEGGKDDDWLCVDCFDTVVHLMMPVTRRAVDLEKHWTTEWPVLNFSDNDKIYDANFEKVLDQYPGIPDDYNVPREDEKVEVTKKKKTTVRRL